MSHSVLLLLCLITEALCSLEGRYNYASFDCAARILSTNQGAKSPSSILHSTHDTYLRNLCSSPSQHVVIELCEDIRIDTVVLANYEFFAGRVREFEVWVSKRYPPVKEEEWRMLGRWEAQNTRQPQTFTVRQPALDGMYTRFIKLKLLSHYGNEYYCALSVVKVFGTTMIDDFAEEEETKKTIKEEQKKKQLDEGTVIIDHLETDEDCLVVRIGKEIRPCPLVSVFNATCPMKTTSNKVHAIQLFKTTRSLQRVVPLRNSPRPIFPIPMKPIRRTIIHQELCFNRNPLQHPMCSSRFKSVKVLQRAYFDPDRITISDLNGSGFFSHDENEQHANANGSGSGKKKRDENIFKSLSDRLKTLERAHTKHALILQAALHRFQFQLDQILSEIDMTDTAARGIESYRDRMQRYLMEYVEERMDRVEEHLDKDRSTQDFNRILIAIIIGNVLLWVAVYLHLRRPRSPVTPVNPAYMSPPVSPARDQSVPKRGDSLERVEQALMDATPLLLFDPETNIVEGIYSPSPSADDDHKLPVDT